MSLGMVALSILGGLGITIPLLEKMRKIKETVQEKTETRLNNAVELGPVVSKNVISSSTESKENILVKKDLHMSQLPPHLRVYVDPTYVPRADSVSSSVEITPKEVKPFYDWRRTDELCQTVGSNQNSNTVAWTDSRHDPENRFEYIDQPQCKLSRTFGNDETNLHVQGNVAHFPTGNRNRAYPVNGREANNFLRRMTGNDPHRRAKAAVLAPTRLPDPPVGIVPGGGSFMSDRERDALASVNADTLGNFVFPGTRPDIHQWQEQPVSYKKPSAPLTEMPIPSSRAGWWKQPEDVGSRAQYEEAIPVNFNNKTVGGDHHGIHVEYMDKGPLHNQPLKEAIFEEKPVPLRADEELKIPKEIDIPSYTIIRTQNKKLQRPETLDYGASYIVPEDTDGQFVQIGTNTQSFKSQVLSDHIRLADSSYQTRGIGDENADIGVTSMTNRPRDSVSASKERGVLASSNARADAMETDAFRGVESQLANKNVRDAQTNSSNPVADTFDLDQPNTAKTVAKERVHWRKPVMTDKNDISRIQTEDNVEPSGTFTNNVRAREACKKTESSLQNQNALFGVLSNKDGDESLADISLHKLGAPVRNFQHSKKVVTKENSQIPQEEWRKMKADDDVNYSDNDRFLSVSAQKNQKNLDSKLHSTEKAPRWDDINAEGAHSNNVSFLSKPVTKFEDMLQAPKQKNLDFGNDVDYSLKGMASAKTTTDRNIFHGKHNPTDSDTTFEATWAQEKVSTLSHIRGRAWKDTTIQARLDNPDAEVLETQKPIGILKNKQTEKKALIKEQNVSDTQKNFRSDILDEIVSGSKQEMGHQRSYKPIVAAKEERRNMALQSRLRMESPPPENVIQNNARFRAMMSGGKYNRYNSPQSSPKPKRSDSPIYRGTPVIPFS